MRTHNLPLAGMVAFVATVLTLSLTACGGSGGGSSPTEPSPGGGVSVGLKMASIPANQLCGADADHAGRVAVDTAIAFPIRVEPSGGSVNIRVYADVNSEGRCDVQDAPFNGVGADTVTSIVIPRVPGMILSVAPRSDNMGIGVPANTRQTCFIKVISKP